MFTVYGTSNKIGSISKMHELLTEAAARAPVAGNAHGSYLTMRSKNGLIFGVINVCPFIISHLDSSTDLEFRSLATLVRSPTKKKPLSH